MCLCDSEKKRESNHCSVRVDNLDYINFKKEYLKRNLPCWSSYMPVNVDSGQEYRAACVTDMAPGSAPKTNSPGVIARL